MYQGYNSFWPFSLQGSAAVQELLTKKDLKLEDLLDEDGLNVEMKTLNQKLFEFLLDPENFKKLINYAIAIPELDDFDFDQKKCYKYPFVCADVLGSDCQAIVAEFFKDKSENKENKDESNPDGENPIDDEVNTDDDMLDGALKDANGVSEHPSFPYLDYLFEILDAEELNFTSAGYFAKIVNNLFAKRPGTLLGYIYKEKPILLEKMVNHICSKSIAEFLAKILTFESTAIVGIDADQCDEGRKKVLQLVLKKLTPENDLEYINNSAYLICEVFGKYNSMHNPNEILKGLLERSTIEFLFEIMRADSTASSCAVALILGNIFAYYILINSAKSYTNSEENIPQEVAPKPAELTDDIPLVKAMIDNLEHITNYIGNTSTGSEAVKSQYGTEVVPFGSARLKILELIIISMKSNNRSIYQKIADCGLIKTLVGLIKKYEWNNMIHNQVEKVITLIIDSNNDDLKVALFEKAQLLQFIADACSETEFTMGNSKQRKIRKGYLGQLIRISNKILEVKDPYV